MRNSLDTAVVLRPGARVGRWTIVAPSAHEHRRAGKKRPRWLCRCDCGKEKDVLGQNLLIAMRQPHGGSRGCGCFVVERSTRHSHASGGKPSSEYMAWVAAKKRCCNPRNASYPSYGGRGIRMCEAWARSFETFFNDMGPRPTEAHSLDRIDPDRDYTPDNCRWATPLTQSRNRRCTRWYAFEGQRLILGDLAARLGITRDQARALERQGKLPAWRILGTVRVVEPDVREMRIDLNDTVIITDAPASGTGPLPRHRAAGTQ